MSEFKKFIILCGSLEFLKHFTFKGYPKHNLWFEIWGTSGCRGEPCNVDHGHWRAVLAYQLHGSCYSGNESKSRFLPMKSLSYNHNCTFIFYYRNLVGFILVFCLYAGKYSTCIFVQFVAWKRWPCGRVSATQMH